MIKEADFCFAPTLRSLSHQPRSCLPLVNLLLSPELKRFDDALLVAETALKLNPKNGQVQSLVEKLEEP